MDRSKGERANAQFKKLQGAEAGKKAMSEYESEQAAVRAKTTRLRALRMARDAEQAVVDQAAAEQAVAAKPTAAKKKPAKPAKEKADSSAH